MDFNLVDNVVVHNLFQVIILDGLIYINILIKMSLSCKFIGGVKTSKNIIIKISLIVIIWVC